MWYMFVLGCVPLLDFYYVKLNDAVVVKTLEPDFGCLLHDVGEIVLVDTNRSAEDNSRIWSSVPFSHPSSFDMVAIDPATKDDIISDLEKFIIRKEYHSRVGRARKRGYLLHGPPGTGKTSLIAAISNFLEFDIYDLELTAVTSNSQLRKLLIATSSKSVIVVEDIDCTLDLSEWLMIISVTETGGGGGFSTVSLSRVLNFVDGLGRPAARSGS